MDRKRKIGKFIVGYCAFAGTFSVLPIGLNAIGIFPDIKSGVWLVLMLGISSFVFKMLFYPFISGEFNFAKYGNDLCLLSFSGLLSAFAFQQSVPFDAFPGARSIGLLASGTPTQENSLALVTLILLVLTLYTLSSLSVWGSSKAGRYSALLAVASWALGTISAMFFVFALSLRVAA